MANLTGLLGTMLATGMAGRSHRGPSFAASPFGLGGGGSRGGFRQTAGLAALGYLAYKAYQDYQRNNPSQPQAQAGSGGQVLGGGQPSTQAPSTQAQARQGGDSLGDRLSRMLRPEQQAAPEAAVDDPKALLLIRAMVAAAAADGVIDADERQRIIGRAEDAGAGQEERRLLERELAAPQSIDTLVRDVRDPETAEQVFLASTLAIEADTPAERSYLQYLAARLNLDPQRAQELQGIA
ncbi:DUF533 domain-containing protein [Azospirillum sp.]|uniref:DUF533 domain-containing protein n=1 Tax=Azospirillum sp. TaxID=34012 RepID=UPI002D6BEBDD|nr:DUF533 domain-containing protein [Azospirillum sp.]HYD71438.1 DUF533 domain-containing protein [Azospirillum sp.]